MDMGMMVALGVVGLAGLVVVLLYNGLVTGRNAAANALSQISVQLQRRHDLVPNLVETARAYMAHERDTLEAVTAARDQAAGALGGGGVARMAGAEAALGGALGRMFALAEAYPDLKADGTMRQLQEELSSTENRVAFARQAYNDAVMSYNNRREMFPANLLAGPFGFMPLELWELEAAEARQPPKVSFAR